MSSAGEQSFVLIRRLADGNVEWIPLETAQQDIAVAQASAYTLVDRANYEAPDTLVAQRRGDDLVVEVGGDEVLVLRGFFVTAEVTFYPTTNVASGAGPFSGTPLSPLSPVLAGSPPDEQVVWAADGGDRNVAPAGVGDGTGGAASGQTAAAVSAAGATSGGGTSPLLWIGAGVGVLGLGAAAGGGGGGSSGGGSGPPPVADTVPPNFTSGGTATAVAENSGAGQVVYTATATDASAVTYSLKAGGDAAAFSVTGNTGAVRLTSNPDFETKSSYAFTVVATDAANNSAERAVSLAINNLDDTAPVITSSATATPINENSGAGQVVYTVTSTDTGDGSTGVVTYSLKAGGDAAAFTINANTGAVTLTGNPDFETQSSYSFTVIATDAAAAPNSSERAVSLAINNIDENAPSVSSVALTGATGAVNNTLNAGDTVQVTVAMSENTNVTGTPRIALNIGGSTVFANYLSGSGSTSLVFQYTVLAGQNDANGISIAANALQLNGGSLTDATGNAANLAHAAVADNASFRVDTVAPSVGSVALTGATGAVNNTLNAGDTAHVTVAMSENATVSGTPRIALNIGGSTVFANYASGSGSTSLLFQYTILAGQNDNNGISIAANALQLNGGSLTDAGGNVANLGHAAVADNASFRVDTVAPSISNVVLSGAIGKQNNTLNAGDRVQVTVTMSENTTVSGTPRIVLNIGGSTVNANYLSGSGSTSLVFEYTILAGQNDNNGISIAANALQMNGGSLTDAGGNAAVLTHASVADNPAFLVDTSAPSVSSVALTGATGAQNDRLNAGDVVSVTVTMSENTVVGGTPSIGLSIGSANVDATYVSGTGTANLVFEYTILAGQTDNNGISVDANSLALNGGSITDAAGNAADLGHGGVANNSSFLVDTTAPTLSSSNPADDETNFDISDDLELAFSETVQAGSGNIAIDSLFDDRTFDINGPQVSISGNDVTIDPGVLAPTTEYSMQIAAGAITDLAGNPYAGIADTTTLNFETGNLFVRLGFAEEPEGTRAFQSMSAPIDVSAFGDDAMTGDDGWTGADDLGSADRALLTGADASAPSAPAYTSGGATAGSSPFAPSLPAAFGGTDFVAFANVPGLTSQGLA